MARDARGRYLWICLAAALASFLAGFTVGWLSKPLKDLGTSADSHQNLRWKLISEMKANNIKSFLRSFTKLPHLAGTEQNLLLAKKIQSQWKKFGLDSAELVHYDVLLSYPNETDASYISVTDEHGIEGFRGGSDGKESACNVGDLGLIPGLGRFPGAGHGNPLECSYLENPMDRGAWRATVHGVAERWTRLSRAHPFLL